MPDKIQSFTDLNAWKEGHRLVLSIYHLTASFPQKEMYSIIDQMRRSASSITCNIAEGFSRRTKKDKSQFYFISLGSITELQNQLVISRDLNYCSREDFRKIAEHTIVVAKLLRGLLKSASSYV